MYMVPDPAGRPALRIAPRGRRLRKDDVEILRLIVGRRRYSIEDAAAHGFSLVEAVQLHEQFHREKVAEARARFQAIDGGRR